VIELDAVGERGLVVVSVDEHHGGRVAQIDVGGMPLLVDDPDHGPLGWGCYPMVPWAGRIGGGRLEFDGRTYRLEPNLAPHAIHGTGFRQAWTVDEQGRAHLDLHCRLDWPFGGVAQQHLLLTGDALTMWLAVQATDATMPATIGWHPWFRKPRRAELAFARMYERGPDHLPTGRVVEPAPPPWDDCFVEPLGPLRVLLDGRPDRQSERLTVTIDSDCDHWVVYDEPAHATCVEPQSGPPDACRLGVATRLVLGEVLQRRMTIRWA
jgi:aldose 1-epimerase